MKCKTLQEIVKVMGQTPDLLVDVEKFVKIVDKYEQQPAFIHQKRQHFR